MLAVCRRVLASLHRVKRVFTWTRYKCDLEACVSLGTADMHQEVFVQEKIRCHIT